MKTIQKLLAGLLLLGCSLNASAWWGGNGWDWNPWPVWTPMYWMEEMVGDDDWYGGNGPYDYGPYGYGPGYGYGYGPGYGGYGAPYYGGYYAPYGGYPSPYYGGGGWR